MNNTGMATRHNVLIVNADTTKGYAIAHELLIGRFRESFGQVWCAVKNASRSGMLFEMGGRVVQLTGESSRDEIMMYMKVTGVAVGFALLSKYDTHDSYNM